MEWSGLLDADLLSSLLTVVIEIAMAFVGIILIPISFLVSVLMPDLDAALLKVPAVFDYASTYMGWIISAFGIPSLVLTLMVGYYLFAVTSKITVWPVKVALSWYRALVA